MNKKNKIDTLQSLRCFAFLVVFSVHTGLKLFVTGAWGVSIFLVLSGFLMTYNYYESDKLPSVSIKNNLYFSISKIGKLYPVYIITTLTFSIHFFTGYEILPISEIIKIILNILLIQEWFPINNGSINGVSWYLCTVIFTYFLFPYINSYMEKKYNKKKAFCMILISIIMQLLIGFIGTEMQNFNARNGELINRNLLFWFVYYFPLSRFWDFFIGSNLAYIYIHNNHHWSKSKYTMLEIISILSVIGTMTIRNLLATNNKLEVENNTFFVWCQFVVIFTISTMTIVYVFAVGKGAISKLLTNKFTLYIAKISPFAFLIHFAVFNCFSIVYYYISNLNYELIKEEHLKWINLTVGFILTVLSCEIWIRITNYVKHKKRSFN